MASGLFTALTFAEVMSGSLNRDTEEFRIEPGVCVHLYESKKMRFNRKLVNSPTQWMLQATA